ncbi:MAG: hypothetical protein ABIQ39_09545 [Ilumatobacteraceae bacterium]
MQLVITTPVPSTVSPLDLTSMMVSLWQHLCNIETTRSHFAEPRCEAGWVRSEVPIQRGDPDIGTFGHGISGRFATDLEHQLNRRVDD